jgi:hypothetical protein
MREQLADLDGAYSAPFTHFRKFIGDLKAESDKKRLKTLIVQEPTDDGVTLRYLSRHFAIRPYFSTTDGRSGTFAAVTYVRDDLNRDQWRLLSAFEIDRFGELPKIPSDDRRESEFFRLNSDPLDVLAVFLKVKDSFAPSSTPISARDAEGWIEPA